MDLKKRGRKTSKQHSLAGSRRPFSNHFSLTSDVKTLRLNPLKKIRFRSSFWWFSCKRNHGFGPRFLQSQRHTSLQNGLKRITGSHFWWFPCKCYRNHSRKLHGLKTGKHGLAGSRRPFSKTNIWITFLGAFHANANHIRKPRGPQETRQLKTQFRGGFGSLTREKGRKTRFRRGFSSLTHKKRDTVSPKQQDS